MRAIRKGLELEGFCLGGAEDSSHSIDIQSWGDPLPGVDGVDGELERLVVNEICKETGGDVVLRRSEGIRSPDRIRIYMPRNSMPLQKVEIGIIKGFGLYAARGARRGGGIRMEIQPQPELTSPPSPPPLPPPPDMSGVIGAVEALGIKLDGTLGYLLRIESRRLAREERSVWSRMRGWLMGRRESP